MRRFCVGLLSDVQYADIPNGQNYQKTRTRYYRGTLNHVAQAIDRWEAASSTPKVDLIFDLGDSLDGYCHRHKHTHEALEKLDRVFSYSKVPVRHVIGNHELYNIFRKDILNSFLYRDVQNELPQHALENDLCYYSLRPMPGFRFLIVDAYEVSVLGLEKSDQRYQDAMKIITSFNSNDDLNDHNNLEKPQYVRYNGGVGDEQIRWIMSELEEAVEMKEKVIIFSHVPINGVCAEFQQSLIWNWDDVSALLGRYNEVVKLVVCGHTHTVMHGFDEYGILHLALPGLIEVPMDVIGFAMLELSEKEIKIDGHGGLVPTLSLKFED